MALEAAEDLLMEQSTTRFSDARSADAERISSLLARLEHRRARTAA